MTFEERAQNILDKHRNYESSDKTVQFFLDNCFRYAYSKGCEETLERVEEWFRTKGPFVFPEDEGTLQSLLTFLKEV